MPKISMLWEMAVKVFLGVFPRPKLKDENLNRAAIVISDFFAILFIYTLGSYLINFTNWKLLGHEIYIANLLVLVGIRMLAYRGRLNLSIALYVFSEAFWYLIVTADLQFFEHLQASNTVAAVAIATILIGPLFGLITTIVFCTMFFGLLWASNNYLLTPLNYWLPPDYPTNGYNAMFMVVGLIGIYIFCWLARTHIFSQLSESISRERTIAAREHAARKAADRANTEKSRFLAAASHDLRQPVSALNLNFESYVQAHPEAKGDGAIQDMASSIQTLNKMLDSVLTVSKLQAKVMMPIISTVKVANVLQRCFAANSARARQKHLKLRMRSTDIHCETDEDMLYRAVNNLVDNAVKYTEHGGIIMGVRRRYGAECIFVMDSGIGIAQESKEVIFEEFTMLVDPSRNSAGSGLGLAIVKRTADLLGMKIHTESKPGLGSTFYLQLPKVRTKPIRQGSEAGKQAGLGLGYQTCLDGLTVAVIDDVLTVRTAICRSLQANGMQTVDAGSWAEMLEKLETVTPDVLITDYQLDKDASGYDVVVAARKSISESLPCFIITGDTSPELVRELAELNVDTLYKPLVTEDLLAAIQNQIAAKPISL